MAAQPDSPARLGRPRVAVVGGGLAGLATAVRALGLGWTPIVLEKRPYLGGRAFSFVDRETGVEVDNGQHVFLGACTEYMAFLREIGAWENVALQDRLDIPVSRNGQVARLRWSTGLPDSLGLMPSLLRYRHLGFIDKLRVAYGMARVRGVRLAGPGSGLDRHTFDAWLRAHGQNDATINYLWNLIVLPALNDDISAVSAEAGIMLFQTALLGGSAAAAIGFSRVALTGLAGTAASRVIEAGGGEVRLSSEVTQVDIENGVVNGVRLANGEEVEAEAVVLAVPHHALKPLLPPAIAGDAPYSLAERLDSAPIVGVHIWYDAHVIDGVFVAVLDSPVQWVFNVDAMHSPASHPKRAPGEPPQQHVVVSLSGAWKWSQMTREELKEVFVPEMAKLFRAARPEKVRRFLSVKQAHATFRCTPGSAAFRPGQRTPLKNLLLAGDWTSTGWPSTMESAVRSGNLAAAALEPQQ
ncbi:MAG: phytoene dehydrogenase [SAR202 cluster bacterium]|nr:phytoene dehydrogenase [SAR202 cluster bacterium]